MKIIDLVRPNIRSLKPYSSARHEFTGDANVLLDANENPYPSIANRYPDPLQHKLKHEISRIKGIDAGHIFLGNGSDEAIDLLIRIFCVPGRDQIVILPPTYGMYRVSASISDVGVVEIPMTREFLPDVGKIKARKNDQCKLLFICTPNNPTGNSIPQEIIVEILDFFPGVVIIDEAYIDFSSAKSMLTLLDQYPNLVVLQTFSKAWGLAGIRLGLAYASTEIMSLLNAVKPPYNVNALTQEYALQEIKKFDLVASRIQIIKAERDRLREELSKMTGVEKIFPSDANFLLVKFKDHQRVKAHLDGQGIVVRDRSKALYCEHCLRITVGMPDENSLLLSELQTLA